jgi:hypothetical protein
MKKRVRVTLVAETTVEMEVEVEEGEDPTHLSPEEEEAAIAKADGWPEWEIDDVEEIP